MIPIKYDATVHYKSTSNHALQKSYTFFAKDDNNAKEIALELFLIDEGVSNDMDVSVSPIGVSLDEESRIDKTLIKVLREVDKVVSGANYVQFLEVFQTFQGKNIKLGKNASYTIEIMGFKIRVAMDGMQAVVCRDEIAYTDETGNFYVIRRGNVYHGN